MAKYKVSNSGYTIEIKNEWKVLDVGSGHNPYPRADVILDKYLYENAERSGKPIKITGQQKFIQGDVCFLPFKNKIFDYITGSHIAEHVDTPENFCQEIIRIGKREYIESPSKFTEILLGEVFHKWYVYVCREQVCLFPTLIFMKKNESYPPGLLGRIFYAIYYANIKRESKPTLYFQNKCMRGASSRLIYCLLRKPWRMFKKMTYTCFEWESEFNYKIIDKNE